MIAETNHMKTKHKITRRQNLRFQERQNLDKISRWYKVIDSQCLPDRVYFGEYAFTVQVYHPFMWPAAQLHPNGVTSNA